jgi:hypothetical protein
MRVDGVLMISDDFLMMIDEWVKIFDDGGRWYLVDSDDECGWWVKCG